MSGNPYAPPKAEVADRVEDLDEKPSALMRFVLATAWAFAAYLLLVFAVGRFPFVFLMIGALALSLVAGVVALCIPVRHKSVFIVPSVLASFVAAFVFGKVG